MRVKEESDKAGLKLSIKKLRSRHSVQSLHGKQKGKKMEIATDFFFLWLQITADGDSNHEMKRCLFLVGNYDKHRQRTKKQRHHISDRGPYSQCMVFPVVMYGCEIWTTKETGHQRINAFKLCWRRLLRIPWTARRSNQSILKENHPEYTLEGLMLKLKLRYFGHLMQTADSFEKTLMLGKIEGRRRKG